MMKMLITLALAASSTPALAADRADQPATRHVRVADLNIATPEGIRALDGRLNAAARAVCDGPDNTELRAKLAYRRCIAATRQSIQATRDAVIAQAQAQRARVASVR